MALTCSRCSRVNPADAQYCYFDGVVLQGQGNQGPLNMATLPFPMPFVFPSGRSCQNFDQLTLACHEESKPAMEALAQGDLASFLGGIGRSDLARVAREAAKAPDLNRGLDDLLAKFPSSILQPPKLAVEPSEINLGELKLGEDRNFNLHLSNQGMRLVYGTISCKDVYLSLGEARGAQQKLFEFKTDLTVPIHIRGKRLVARPKPYEAKIVIDSSGGPAEVVLRFNISVKPFPQGVLAGAVSPRQIAEKAKAHPKEAAPFFENGTVARWYKENGWDYPVKGPATSGLAAIQQFFEAHGLAKAPKVGINQNQIVLMGAPGETIRHQLEVRTHEKRSVYALASSNQPWVTIESTPPRGQVAAVNLLVTVPDYPGETLQAKVMIRANGNQQFAVPVSLQVGGPRRAGAAAAVGAGAAAGGGGGGLDRNLLAGLADASVPSRPYSASAPIALQPLATPAAVAPRSRPPRGRDDDDDHDRDFVPRKKKRGNPLRHLVPALLLLLPLAGFFVHDVLVSAPGQNIDVELPPEPDEKLDMSPWVALRMQDAGHPYPREVDTEGRLGGTMRFGLIMTKVADPNIPSEYKRLTFGNRNLPCRGYTNNTVIRVDSNDCIFGQLPGHWLEPRVALPKDTKENRDPDGARSVWTAENATLRSGKIVVTQIVEVVRGQTNVLDTCLVRYQVENKDNVAHKVGVRFMLDTFIGAEDGVPFAIPGKKGLCDTMDEFNEPAKVPDFIQAYEHNDMNNPGTIALVQFRVGGGLEPPSRVTLGAWPDPKIGEARKKKDNPYQQFMTGWNVPLESMQTMRQIDPKASADSCVVMYWPEQELKAGEKRVIGFSYGLGTLGTQKEGKLGLSFGGSTELGGEFSITALVTNPSPGQNVSLQLPQGLTLVEGDANQVVPAVPENSARPVSTVTWKVKASKEGVHTIGVESGTLKASLKVRIRKPEQRGVFD